MSSRNTMLLVFNRGGPGSYRSRELRGMISQKETRFYSERSTTDSRSLNQHYQNRRVRSKTTHTGQAKPYPLAAAANHDEYQAQYAAEFHLRVR